MRREAPESNSENGGVTLSLAKLSQMMKDAGSTAPKATDIQGERNRPESQGRTTQRPQPDLGDLPATLKSLLGGEEGGSEAPSPKAAGALRSRDRGRVGLTFRAPAARRNWTST